jgi:hypothetical protein
MTPMTKKAAPRIASEKYSMSVSSLNTGESDSVTFFIVMILLFTNQPSKVRVVLGVLSSQHSIAVSCRRRTQNIWSVVVHFGVK